ncbi:hypothetical protein F511_36189 [Dorcoceras hygrometricum]|uniref:Dystroglycan-like n=1 Tax=Dorcoceras hygrometricum TaxID=472368 RepID=A0A2Z7C6B0_9LAMI|nr:hypothetical protein F511_36189 [Dorcoceras hygrometricum]
MASPFITNALQVNFGSVLEIADNEGMVTMFRALEASGLRGFLGCQSVLYEKELEQFFDTALVQDGDITGAVSGKFFSISESRFAEVFGLPTEGLVDVSEAPKNLINNAKSIFSKTGQPISTYGKKRLMKYEFRMLNDILAKSITVKAGSFDAVTNERFLMITAIHFGVKVNWSKILFGILKEMVDKTLKKAKGNCEEEVELQKKSESTSEEAVEVVSEVVGSKKRPSVAGDEPVVTKKKRTIKGKASSSQTSKAMVTVAQDVEPLQIFKPTPATTAEQPLMPKPIETVVQQHVTVEVAVDEPIVEHTAEEERQVSTHEGAITDDVDVIIGHVLLCPNVSQKKRRLVLSKGSDDEYVEERVAIETVVQQHVTVEVAVDEPIVEHTAEEERQVSTHEGAITDDVDVIIGHVLAETSQLETIEVEQGEQRFDETTIET